MGHWTESDYGSSRFNLVTTVTVMRNLGHNRNVFTNSVAAHIYFIFPRLGFVIDDQEVMDIKAKAQVPLYM
jgi:hypothetical protein